MTVNKGRPAFDLMRRPADAIAAFFAQIALAAGPAIMAVYDGECVVRAKDDASPVTLADEQAEAIILRHLAEEASPLPVVAEEAVAKGGKTAISDAFILVDPLDGTREFIARNGEFTVNIALVRDRRVVAGAVYAPALEKLWFGGERAYFCTARPGADLPAPAQWRRLRVRQAPASVVALASRSHSDPATEAFLAGLPVGNRRSAGSSLKFCAIAEGEADVYPRFAPTMEWDTAAGEAVLRAAGGIVEAVEGGPLLYAKTESRLRNGGFIAWGDPAFAAASAGARQAIVNPVSTSSRQARPAV
jgi:3'(2'), 5'-bisphosphate nucleotidase